MAFVNAIGVGDVVTNILNDVVEDGRAFAQHGEAAPIGRAAQPRRSPRSLRSGLGASQFHGRLSGHGRWRHDGHGR